jgi:hypothetical protein
VVNTTEWSNKLLIPGYQHKMKGIERPFEISVHIEEAGFSLIPDRVKRNSSA